MMAHKHLHELLKEDQEPFHLQTYISERCYHLKPPNSSTQISKRKPITNNLCKHVCFLSFHHDSPDIWRSPFQEPRQNGTILPPVPALLLEAAMRIQNTQRSHKKSAQVKNLGFGILGSVLKKLKDRKNNKKEEFGNSRTCQNEKMEEKSFETTSFPCNCSSTTLSSFSLHTSPLSGHCSPDLPSPVYHNKENPKSSEGSNNEVGDEQSEQCSPVSVLDTPFENHHVAGNEDANEDEVEDNYDDDLECSFAIVQEAKERLLDKLRRFEKLAELDFVELEKRMMEESNEEENDDEAMSAGRDGDLDTLMMIEALSLSSFECSRKLVPALIQEENDDKYGFKNKEVMIRRVSRRLSSWKEVEPNEIVSLVTLDFERKFGGMKMNVEETGEYPEIVQEIEIELFRLLMEEVACELLHMKCNPKV